MKLWSDFFRAISTLVAECPTFTMEEAIRRAAIDYFTDSRAWRVEGVTLATTVIDQRAYTVATANPTGAALIGLPEIWIGDEEVEELAPGDTGEQSSTYSDTTWRVGVTGPTGIVVVPGPTEAGVVIKATAAYAPTDASTGLDDALYAAHRKPIENMAAAALLMQKARPWYDPNLARELQRQADADAMYASTMAGPTRRNPLRTRPL